MKEVGSVDFDLNQISIPKKCPSGICGLDEVLHGGLPRGRVSLVSGSPGCGKTLMALSFLIKGAKELDEPGLFVSFEEPPQEVLENTLAFDWGLLDLVREEKIHFFHVKMGPVEYAETGEYDLSGLMIRLESLVKRTGIRRVVFDGPHAFFDGLSQNVSVRSEFRRFCQWLKDMDLTSFITTEKTDSQMTRLGWEDYLADCFLSLDHRVHCNLSTRRLRVMKYRGSKHGTNEYPFLISEEGLSILPITGLSLDHDSPREKISSGIVDLDALTFDGKGFYRGSSILLSGMAGSGKTSLAVLFALGACQRGEKALICSFEESPGQLMRNMESINLDLKSWQEKGQLHFKSVRPSHHGLESHLVSIQQNVETLEPSVVVLDPLTSLLAMGEGHEVSSMLTRMIDFLKSRDCTGFFTALETEYATGSGSGAGVSSLMDVWMGLDYDPRADVRRRQFLILKARGLGHETGLQELFLSNSGVTIKPYFPAENEADHDA